MKIKNIVKNKYFILILITLLSSSILICKDIFLGDDLNFHLSRILFIKNNFVDGNIFSKLYYLFDYGYGGGFFYPDFFLYIPSMLFSITNNIVFSYKSFLVLINLLSILSAYYSVYSITKSKRNAIVITIIYAFLPYRLCTMYYRASLGETISFIFFPLAISGFFQILKKETKKWYLLTIGMSGLILSHLLSAILILIALIPLTLINIKKIDKKVMFSYIKAAIMTILLTSFFIFPMIEQLSVSKYRFFYAGCEMPLKKSALSIFNVFNSYNNFFKGTGVWLPPGIGIILTLSIIVFIIKYKKLSKNTKKLYILGIIILLLTTNIFPWKLLNKYVRIIQFPWRILPISIIILLTAFSSMLLDLKNDKKKYNMLLVFVLLLSLINIITCYFSLDRGKTSKVNYYIAWGEYLPSEYKESRIFNKKISDSYTLYYIKPNDLKIYSKNKFNYVVSYYNHKYVINFNNNSKNNVLNLPIIYYKGYVGYINNKKTNVFKTKDGNVGIKVSDNKGEIIIKYKDTFIQNISKIISGIGLIYLILSIYKDKITLIIKKRN